MKQDIAELWIKALESGEYEQTQKALRNDEGMCCLGVLCDLHMKHTGKGEWAGVFYNSVGVSDMLTPPQPVLDWAGLGTSAGKLALNKPYLAELNDGGKNFKEISTLIRENVETL